MSAATIACPRCRRLLAPGGRYCDHCGAKLGQPPAAVAHSCARCGASLADGARFCDACGAAVTGGDAGAPRRRRAGVLVAGAVAVMVAAGVAVALVRRTPGPGLADEPPTTQVAAATVAYLTQTGAVLERHREAARGLRALPPTADPRTCAAERQRVERESPMLDAVVAVEAVPDQALKQLLLGGFSLEAAVLQGCGTASPSSLGDRLTELRRYDEATEARLTLIRKEAQP